MEFTGEQRNFIEDRGHNILVSAAAGSGKTAVIVERALDLIINEGYDVTELLLVTFTRAAAAEMRDRIREALSDRLLSEETAEEKREHLMKQMTLIFSADITTIDSFCLNLVREHFNICRIDPSFRVADEGELKLIAEEVMEALLEEKYETGGGSFYRFVDDVSTGRDDSAVADAIRSVYGFAQARPDPAGYIAAMTKEYDVDDEAALEDTVFIRGLLDIAAERTELALKILRRAEKICEEPAGPYTYAETIADDIKITEGLRDMNTYDGMRSALQGISFKALSRRSDPSIDPELKEQVKELRGRARKIINDVLIKDLFAKSGEDIIYEMRMCLPEVKELSALTLEYSDRFSAAKRERGVADFSDLEHMALEILRDDETREMISRRYKELIIDEYQDCNRIQEEIFSAISNGHNYVTVGDVKQSIYSFRDACPELFMDKYRRYSKGDGPDSVLITLSKNFRSSMPVVESVNSVFEEIMTEKCGGAAYDESQSLHYGGLYEGTGKGSPWRGEYISIETDPDGKENAIETEARVIASRIRELVGENAEGNAEGNAAEGAGECEKGDEGRKPLYIEDRKSHEIRKCGYGDIVILLRSVKAVNDAFAKVFAEEGVPVVFDSSSGYLLSYEIREIMNLLTIIDNPRQDIPLAGVMMGYFGGFDASDMVYVRSYSKETDLYRSLCAAAADTEGRPHLAEKCAAFLKMLGKYRERSVYTPIQELIDIITNDFQYDHYVRAMNDGARREGNLRLLKKRAADYEQTSFHGLFKFLRYIDNLKKYDVDFGEASGSSYSDAVRIMSIHHSKGLEFPVVFVSTLRRDFNRSDSRAAMLFDDELGIGADLMIRDRNLKIRTLIKKVIARRKNLQLVSEEMRVLYVAMTRAENKLILTAGKRKKGTAKTDPAEAGTLAELMDTALLNIKNDCYDLTEVPFVLKETEGAYERKADPAVKRIIELSKSVKEEDVKNILSGLSYVYPYERSLNVPQKVSVSYIKHEAMEEKGVSVASDPRGDKIIPTAGALRGTAVHTAFENLPLDMEPDEEKVNRFLDGLVIQKKLGAKEREYIKASDIMDFLNSPVSGRMREAGERGELYREQPFIISVPASRIDPSYPEEDRIMVQGIIDAFFIEADKIVVVDYKTDRVDNEKILTDRYQAQLDYYESALRQLMGAEGSEKIIYSVSLAREIVI